ncbi:hypothetical protein L9F63_001355, partial [Diploptera punctata]
LKHEKEKGKLGISYNVPFLHITMALTCQFTRCHFMCYPFPFPILLFLPYFLSLSLLFQIYSIRGCARNSVIDPLRSLPCTIFKFYILSLFKTVFNAV